MPRRTGRGSLPCALRFPELVAARAWCASDRRRSAASARDDRTGARTPGPAAVAAMGQCLSWALGLLLPSLWEAEVAISATALLIAALVLFLLTSDQHAAKPTAAGSRSSSPASSSSSRPSAAAAARHRDAGRCGRSGARGKAASEISCAPGAGGYVIKVTACCRASATWTWLSTARQKHPSHWQLDLISVPFADCICNAPVVLNVFVCGLSAGAALCQVPDRRQLGRQLRSLRRHLLRRAEALQVRGSLHLLHLGVIIVAEVVSREWLPAVPWCPARETLCGERSSTSWSINSL